MRYPQTVLALSVLAGLSALTLLSPSAARAQITGFVNNETNNAGDWNTFVTGLGETVDTTIDMQSPPPGALSSTFYQGSVGATFTSAGFTPTIVSGNGPSDGNNTSPTLSPGEGPSTATQYLLVPSPQTSGPNHFTTTFAAPVSGFGLFVVDYFGALGFTNTLTLTAFSGADGTGTNLGSVTAASFNFQTNNEYFMGLATTGGAATIASVVFDRPTDNSGDAIGLIDFRFSRLGATAAPEPGSIALAACGALPLAGMILRRRRRA